MNLRIEQRPFKLDMELIKGIREVLKTADFTEKGILDHLNQEDSLRVNQKEVPYLMYLTAGGSPLETLIRLLVMNVAVDRPIVQRAVDPMTIESWVDIGLLRFKGEGSVHSNFRLIPSGPLWVAFDPSHKNRNQKIKPDHVHGPGPSSIRLIHATLRQDVGQVLDMGTGCGIQGLLCAAHSDRVISTDINPRALNIAAFNAALNGIRNVEYRMGSLFEPVQQDRFDLIVVNPPFAISPENRLVFRDGGMDKDGFVERIIHEAPGLLNEDGFCQLNAQWAHIRGTPWEKRFQNWFQSTGCDVWVLKLATESPTSYATNWLNETEKLNQASYIKRWEQWRSYYEEQKIEAVSTGFISMRKTKNAEHWYRFDEDGEYLDEEANKFIHLGFHLRDFSSTASKEALLGTIFSLSDVVRLKQHSRPSGDSWAVERLVLTMTRGIHYTGNVDGRMIGLLGRCNGKIPLKDLIQELADVLKVHPEQITDSVLGIIRKLMERGYIMPDHLPNYSPQKVQIDRGGQKGEHRALRRI